MTDEADRRLLLRLARAAIAAHVNRIEASDDGIEAALASSVAAHRLGAAFVTIHYGGELRGCIGHLDVMMPLVDVIRRSAVSACSDDPRFPPVTAAELPAIVIELSLLGPLEPVTDPDEIDVGRHGLVIEQGGHRGLLLPQVATEWQWDRETFLTQTCRKAGLPRDAWKTGAAIWKFEAEVFGETDI